RFCRRNHGEIAALTNVPYRPRARSGKYGEPTKTGSGSVKPRGTTTMRKILTVALLGTTLALAACGGNTDETAMTDDTGAMADTTMDTGTMDTGAMDAGTDTGAMTTDPMTGDPAAPGAAGAAGTPTDGSTGMEP